MEEKDSFFLQSLARLSRALFCQVDSQDILDGALFFDDISFQTAADYMMLDPDTSLSYSRMECRKTAEFAADFVHKQRKTPLFRVAGEYGMPVSLFNSGRAGRTAASAG